ncbi:MAG: hypothetical protein RBR87_03200 [Bacteroidales bacterium]|jgi:hypothetical protein|nr:hypothetical protein [Bacteroidales bacterium]
MRCLKEIILITGFFTIGFMALGQSVEAIGQLDRDTIKMGEHLNFELNMKAPEGFEVFWPDWGDTLSKKVEIISKSDIQQQPLDTRRNIWMKQNIIVTSFDTGVNIIPPVKLEFSPKGDSTVFTATSAAISFYVQPMTVDTTASFKPIKGPRGAPISFLEILPWIIGILGFLGVTALALWYFLRRQRKTKPIPVFEKPKIPPYKTAIEQLEELRHKKLWQNGHLKDYYSEMTDIVRSYIENQFGVQAVEMTTDEILIGIKPLRINEAAVYKLKHCLQLADLVKFAKAEPLPLEHDICLDNSLIFVKESHANTRLQQPEKIAETEKKEEL